MSQMTGLTRAWVVLAVMGGAHAACAQSLADPAGQQQGQAVQPAAAAVAPLPSVSSAASVSSTDTPIQPGETTGQSTIDELQRQIQARALTEMRTSYNGSYGASLLFNVNDGTYFIALFQQKAFWRVIKTQSDVRAEAIYRDFSHQAERLATNELQTTRLAAQKAQTDRQIEVTQARARRLQADLSIAREQQATVADRQRAARTEAAALQAQQAQLQSQLRTLQQQVRSLQREADAGLPAAR